MFGKSLRTAVYLFLALGMAGGLLLSGYVFWIEFYDAIVLGAPNRAFCTPVPGNSGDIPIADSVYSCRIAGEYLFLTLFYPPAIVIFWTSLITALLVGAVALWDRINRLLRLAATSTLSNIPPTHLAMGFYGMSVLCLGIAGQISDGWYPLGPFALMSWPALLLPLPIFAAVHLLRQRHRDMPPV